MLSEDPYEKKLGAAFYKKILKKEGEDVYDGIATSLGMWNKMEYDATREYLCQNGGFIPVPVSTQYTSCEDIVRNYLIHVYTYGQIEYLFWCTSCWHGVGIT